MQEFDNRQGMVQNFNSCIIIRNMINPHQNININISYNLTHPKTSKPAPAKRISKIQKLSVIPTSQCDIEIKVKGRHEEDKDKNKDPKKAHDKKPHRKKPSNFARNTFTPDLFNDRRIKTQGPSADLDAAKRDSKPKIHSKSTQPAAAKAIAAAISSKKSGSTKAVRSGRQGHVNSFQLINNPKKTLKPLRLQCDFSLPKNDRVVSKLLNMSLLASELGGSRPATSSRQGSEEQTKTFKEYLSSMDMRLLRTMQDDVPTFMQHGNSQEVIKAVMSAKGLSLEQFTCKVVKIQRAWRKVLSKAVVHKYKLLFRQATDKLSRQHNSHDLSVFAESPRSDPINSNHKSPLHVTSAQIPFLIREGRRNSRESSLEESPLKWSEEGRRPHLDLAKYQELVLKQERKHFDPAALLDSFMEQSQYNRNWIENEFQPSSSKPSRANSPEKQSQPQQQEQEDSLDGSQDYNRIKYSSPEEEHQALEKRMRELQEKREQQGRRVRPHERNRERQEDIAIKGYLECGLGNFGLHVDQRMLNLQEKEGDSDVEQDSFSDEAIGAQFQQINRANIRINLHPEEKEPAVAESKQADLDRTVQDVIGNLISEFAVDISTILRRAAPSVAPPKPAARVATIQTGFAAVRNYVSQLIAYLQLNEQYLQKIVSNINKDIGPTSLEILSYLRPDGVEGENSSLSFEEEGLFVVPAELFQEFQSELERRKPETSMRARAYANFWHRCIFESFNECLDYQRPYGLEGRPYNWITNVKIFRPINSATLSARLLSAQERLLELTMMVGGVIFQKPDSPFAQADFSDEEKHRINEQRLSRILATELLESEPSWTNYSDETAELQVELARMLETSIYQETTLDLQRVRRRRKLLPDLP